MIKKYILMIFIASFMFGAAITYGAEYRNYIYYHCADWGPAESQRMRNEDKYEEKIYFIKQIIFEENQRRFGNAVYFCSMNLDGSEKREIKKLWEDTRMYIDINVNTSFMDICYKTKQAAIAFSAGHQEQTGLWLINLDGTGFKRIVEQKWSDDFRPRVNHPSWFPDGGHLVYEEKWLQENITYYIVKVDKNGKDKVYLTTKEDGGKENRYPVISPDGQKIAYTHFWYQPENKQKKYGRDLWIMDADGKNKKILYNERHYADYPEWSFDGSMICIKNPEFRLIDAETGKEVFKKKMGSAKAHWNKKDMFIMDGRGSIYFFKKEYDKPLPMARVNYIFTKNRRDLSQPEYSWGGINL